MADSVFIILAIFVVLAGTYVLYKIKTKILNLIISSQHSQNTTNKHLDLISQQILASPNIGSTQDLDRKNITLNEVSKLEGAWGADEYYKVRGICYQNESLFASLTGPKQDGPNGAIYRLKDDVWINISELYNGPKKPTENIIYYNKKLVVASYDGVWFFEGEKWSQENTGLSITMKNSVYDFCIWNHKLVASMWGVPALAIYDEEEGWRYLPEPTQGWCNDIRTIYCLTEYRGDLYIGTGTGKLSNSTSQVWRFDGKGWEQVGGDGIRSSWQIDGIPFILSLTVIGSFLVANLSRPKNKFHNSASNIWIYDGERWYPYMQGKLPALFVDSSIPNHSIVHNNAFFVATGDNVHNNINIWTEDKEKGFSPLIELNKNNLFDEKKAAWIYRMCSDEVKNQIYFATAGHLGAAKIFRINFKSD